MKFRFTYLLVLLFWQFSLSQEGFYLDTSIKKTIIPFEVYNNLIVIPVNVNGVDLKFLLDTGVKESIIFSIDETNEINFSQVEKINIRGFGGSETFEGYKSSKNQLKIKNYIDTNHTLFLILNQEINISTQVGIPINGILGYYFFKNNLLKINYETKKITVYNTTEKLLKKVKKSYATVDLDFLYGKPYINTAIILEENTSNIESKLLLDIGNSDAIWLFKNKFNPTLLPKTTLDDYLGRGFSGDIYGDRARINQVAISNFKFKNPLVAFPQNTSKKEGDSIYDRSGSLGSEIMKRFTTYYDYPNKALYLKQNSSFNDPFSYNMSGLEIHHQGLQWIKQTYQEGIQPIFNVFSEDGDKSVTNNLKYKFELKPIYVISNVRKDSPADLSGLQKDDIIVKINNRNGYQYKLQQISDLLKSEEGKTIEFEVERKGKNIKCKFQLKKVI